MSKRSIASFFPAKRVRLEGEEEAGSKKADVSYESHPSYPIPLPASFPFPISIKDTCRSITDKEDLSLQYYQPLFPAPIAKHLFEFLRAEFCWYRVTYEVRGMTINTPRFTTVFGLDDTHEFNSHSSRVVHEKATGRPPKKPLNCTPRPLPGCLVVLKDLIESISGDSFNFCLLNYYKDNSDSISYHSDDEHFLGPDPTIASISLGAPRDFHMRHKSDHGKTWKCTLRPGDMLFMRDKTQSKWDHAVPKRKNGAGQGRINITFRKAIVRYGTENYYRYNVHNGPYYRWNEKDQIMVLGNTDHHHHHESSSSSLSIKPKPDGGGDHHTPNIQRQVSSTISTSSPQPTPKVTKEESFDLEAHIKAIDEAVAKASHAP